MKVEDSVRTRLVILTSILGECNEMGFENEDPYWDKVKEIYESRGGRERDVDILREMLETGQKE